MARTFFYSLLFFVFEMPKFNKKKNEHHRLEVKRMKIYRQQKQSQKYKNYSFKNILTFKLLFKM